MTLELENNIIKLLQSSVRGDVILGATLLSQSGRGEVIAFCERCVGVIDRGSKRSYFVNRSYGDKENDLSIIFNHFEFLIWGHTCDILIFIPERDLAYSLQENKQIGLKTIDYRDI